MKTVLFVPGFQESFTSRNYRSTVDAIKAKGYEVVFVDINWKRTILSDWVEQLDEVYSEHNPAETILAGFSYGSMTAFVSASKRNPSELWLFSLSPYFSDDIPEVKQAWLNYIGKRRTEYFRQLDFNELASKILCKTLIVYGALEARRYPLIGRRSRIAHNNISGSSLVCVSGVAHDVTNPLYVAAIKAAI